MHESPMQNTVALQTARLYLGSYPGPCCKAQRAGALVGDKPDVPIRATERASMYIEAKKKTRLQTREEEALERLDS